EFDLYVLDGLNTMGLTNAGVLADLYTYMDNDANFKRETYYMNLWSLFEKNGCLYEFVPTFNIAGTYGAESVIGDRTGWTIDEFTTLADQYGGPRNLLVNNRSLVLGYMIQYGLFPYIDLENSTCDFTNEGFYQWLNFIGGFTTDSNYEAPLSCGWIYDFNQYYDLTVSTDDTIIVAGMPAEDAGGPVVMALNAYGISATTEHPELCWDFLMSLMEDETQERLTGFSMRRDRMEEQFRRATISNDNPDALFYGWTVGEEEAPYPCMTQESVDYFRNLLENINRCAFRNDDIYNIIIEEATAYFNETKDPISIETVAAQIQDRVLKCLQETAK
ncbi:MAG: hypothetical protein PUD50_13505, partial [Eubacteriales bacterium]|nr:hypothetical protein [Eubacteriales bacterium]